MRKPIPHGSLNNKPRNYLGNLFTTEEAAAQMTATRSNLGKREFQIDTQSLAAALINRVISI
jgi:hypothetical protein